jgi:oligoribonuclease
MSKKLNIQPKQILWLDLEMTGLSAAKDLILEVGAIVTDWNFKEIATYHGVIKNTPTILKKRLALNGAFWDSNPKARDGLIAQNKTGKPLDEIENELIALINDTFPDNQPVLLGGNSIHIDRQFIAANWPKLDARLFYRMLDVSAWKVVFEGKFGKSFLKPDGHRALDDIRGSIIELQYYLNMLKI